MKRYNQGTVTKGTPHAHFVAVPFTIRMLCFLEMLNMYF